jgi:hypothetical protein
MPDGNDPPTYLSMDSASASTMVAPIIDIAEADELANGWYEITGHVTGDPSGGLKVTFSGIPAVNDETATTDSDGDFTLVFMVKNDGSDTGTVAVQTSQNGMVSNIKYVFVDPTH